MGEHASEPRTAPEVLVAKLCAVLMTKGVLNLGDVREVLGTLAPTDAELLDMRPDGMGLHEAMDRIAGVSG